MTIKSSIGPALDNAIFRKTRSKSRRPELLPSEIPTYDYTAHMKSVRDLRMRTRRKNANP